MELDQQRPYSVLTREKVRKKMKEQINEISQIFWLSKSDATVLLMYLRWDSLRVSERLGENKDKLLMESGLILDSYSDSSSEFNLGTWVEFDEIVDDKEDEDDDLKISTPFCSHKFSTTDWREYLEKDFYSVVENQATIFCPNQHCRAAVGPETIEKLTVRDQELYESYVLRSYIEGNKVLMIKQCPAPNCSYLIEFHQQNNGEYDGEAENYSSNVVCLCGHIFCWRCRLESHRPVSCNNASDWLSKDLRKLEEESEQSSIKSWTETSKKTCPRCLCPAELLEGNKSRKFLTCACRFIFCWRYLSPGEALEKEPTSPGPCVSTEVGISCGDHWELCEISLKKAESDLQAFVKSNIKKPSILAEEDIRIIRQGLMLIVQCRRVLKWCCVYDYIHTEYENSKEYLRHLQGNATMALQKYSNTLQEQIDLLFTQSTWEKRHLFRLEIPTATSNIGHHFYHFIKSLENGMVDVMVKPYYGVGGQFWYCDRCTYGNAWSDMECKMCCDATASTLQQLNDLSLN